MPKFQSLFKRLGPAPLRIVVAGKTFSPTGVTPLATVTIRNHGVLRALMLDPEVAFGEGYTEERIQVEGDLVALLETLYGSTLGDPQGGTWYSRLASKFQDVLQSNTLSGSRHNIHSHYDLGNDFYKLWLDRELVYTCAYFPSPSATLEEAQTAKVDYVCRKLRLQPGETVVEAGCGWGAQALHMARNYGVSVKAFNVSHEQIVYARERAREQRLDHQVEFIEDDYRNIRGKFDAFVSIGMLEHVGLAHYRELGEIIHRAVGENGRGLLHFLGRTQPAPLSRWIRKHIFPGGYIPTLKQALDVLEPWNYGVQDVENLRWHYAKTMEHWLQRFEQSKSQVEAMYDAQFFRAWRLYLAGSLAAFRVGTLQLFQVVFSGPRCAPISWTRARLYESDNAGIEKPSWTHAMS